MNLRADGQLIAAGGQRTALCDDVARRAVPGNATSIILFSLTNTVSADLPSAFRGDIVRVLRPSSRFLAFTVSVKVPVALNLGGADKLAVDKSLDLFHSENKAGDVKILIAGYGALDFL